VIGDRENELDHQRPGSEQDQPEGKKTGHRRSNLSLVVRSERKNPEPFSNCVRIPTEILARSSKAVGTN
ncbi:MAG: hypothetical protein ACR2RE_26340, partial [Geminicoccaceae bacterium]